MVQVTVIGNDVAQSLKILKKKMQREGIFRERIQRRKHGVRQRLSEEPESSCVNA